MSEVGIRALKQNASAVVAAEVAGETVTITERGRPVAQLVGLQTPRLQILIESGRARPPRIRMGDLGRPSDGPPISAVLAAMRDDERY